LNTLNSSTAGAAVRAIGSEGALTAVGCASSALATSLVGPNAVLATRIAAIHPSAVLFNILFLIVINLPVLNVVHYIHNRKRKRLQQLSTFFLIFLNLLSMKIGNRP
jgi:hypothetical protein